MTSFDTTALKSVFAQFKEIMDDNRDRLIDLDRALGDGDLGLTMTKAFNAAHDEVRESTDLLPRKLLMKAGMSMAKNAPSTMGTLLATGFMRGGKALGEAQELSVDDLSVFFRAFVDGLMERGKTKPGNKTIVDSLNPAAEALAKAASENKDLNQALADACEAARRGADAAKQMTAQHGRAAYFKDESIGKEDGGAEVGVLILSGFERALGNK